MKWLIIFCFSYNIASGQITSTDRDTLTKHLNTLSQTWVAASVDICNSIFATPSYTWQDWRTFFDNYYTEFTLTDALINYLGYPTFFWINAETHFKLQQGQKWAFIQQIDSIFSIPNLGSQLSSNALLKQELFNYSKFLDDITYSEYTALPDSSLDNIDLQIATMISNRPFLKRNQTISPITQPYVAISALKIHSILLRLKPMTPARIDYIGNVLSLPAPYITILQNHTIFIDDNDMMSSADLLYIDTLLKIVPNQIHDLRILTNNDYLYAQGQNLIAYSYYLPAVNVSGTIGGYQENGFPSDIAGYSVDGFGIVVGHELNHRVDPDYIYLDPIYNARREQLLVQAGNIDLNYLRSSIGGAFQTNPQEFFASMSNLYLANTLHTLELGVQRFFQGYKEPINQFLYFSEIYSLRGNTTKFYLNNTQAQIQSFTVSVIRDARNFINEFTFNSVNYRFTLDTDGNVLDIVITQLAPLPVTLIKFIGRNSGNINELSWEVAHEDNLNYYELQRSIDGVNFNHASQIKAVGNTNYTYNDILTTPTNFIYFYRLKILDFDGNFNYSDVIKIVVLNDLAVLVNPNPFKDILIVTVQSDVRDKATFVITDLSGRQLFRKNESLSPGTNVVQVSENLKLPKGAYLLTIITSQKTHSVKIVKSN